jgi:hypothetical protein
MMIAIVVTATTTRTAMTRPPYRQLRLLAVVAGTRRSSSSLLHRTNTIVIGTMTTTSNMMHDDLSSLLLPRMAPRRSIITAAIDASRTKRSSSSGGGGVLYDRILTARPAGMIQQNTFVRTTTSSSSSSASSSTTGDSTPQPPPTTTPDPAIGAAIVYESPLAKVVGKLRGVSLLTAIVGAVGVPIMVALKGSIPDAGMLAIASTFVTGSLGSTAAIHYIFGPYVYSIERIPVRVCSSTTIANEEVKQKAAEVVHDTSAFSKLASEKEERNEQEETNIATSSSSSAPQICSSTSTKKQPTLLKATIKSIFLRPHHVIFDPQTDVEPYKGLRPMCNLIAKGRPLYVHPGTYERVVFIYKTNKAICWLCDGIYMRFSSHHGYCCSSSSCRCRICPRQRLAQGIEARRRNEHWYRRRRRSYQRQPRRFPVSHADYWCDGAGMM